MMKRAATSSTAAKHRRMLEVLRLFRVVFKSIRQHYKSVQSRAGISGAQLWALSQIADHPGINVGDLARALAVHQSTASNLLRGLAGAGLVMRRRVRKDQRSVTLFPTDKGNAALKRAPRPLIGVLQQALSDLPADDLVVLERKLERLVARMHVKDTAARATPLSQI
jgi:DNA-binding MarR family transcriptional regulator